MNRARNLFEQVKELNELFEKQPASVVKPERYLRSAHPESVTPTLGKSMTEETLVVVEEDEPVDPTSFFDPVNILDKLPKNFYDDLVFI